MNMEPLGEWCRSDDGNVMVPTKALGHAPLVWLQWAAPYIDPALVGVLCAEPVVSWPNISGALRLSRRHTIRLSDAGEIAINRDAYRCWTTLNEVWGCNRRILSGELALTF